MVGVSCFLLDDLFYVLWLIWWLVNMFVVVWIGVLAERVGVFWLGGLGCYAVWFRRAVGFDTFGFWITGILVFG